MTSRFFVDARFGLNKILFPTYQNGTDQTLLDTATNIRTRNFNTDTERFRDRYQANATGAVLRGRGRWAAVTSSSSASTTRTRRSKCGHGVSTTSSCPTAAPPACAVDVTLFGAPFFTKTAVDVTAIYVQDSYSVKRLTLTGGVRWERLEGYLPEQSSPASRGSPICHALVPRAARHRQLAHDRTAPQRGLRRQRQRTDRAQGVGRALLLRDCHWRRCSTRPTPTRTIHEQLHLERHQRRSAIPARRADRDAGHHRRRCRRRSRSIRTTGVPTPTSTPVGSTTSCSPRCG